MPFDVVWDDQDPSIVRLDITGENTWEEAYTAFDKAVEFITSKTGRVDVVFNGVTPKALPKGNPIPHFKAGFIRLCKPANAGNIYIVTHRGVPKIAQPFMHITLRMYNLDQNRIGGNFRTLEEVRVQIARDRAKVTASTG